VTARTWPEDWDDRLAGVDCPMCANQGRAETEFGARILAGTCADVFLQRAGPLPGYAIAMWNSGHVAEPTDLDETEAATYWNETLAASRAIAALFNPAKMNYQTLGNAVPHLHTHILPRYLDDPAPGKPLPWDLVSNSQPIPEDVFSRQVEDLRRLVGGRGR
jgi:diadenosine tetraphosphate (Ap4A) HIT family hydrolase